MARRAARQLAATSRVLPIVNPTCLGMQQLGRVGHGGRQAAAGDKCKFFTWLLLQNRVWTADRLLLRE
jgi:hypothetical protein